MRLSELATRAVDAFATDRTSAEDRRVARLLVAASAALAPITFGLAAARWVMDGWGSRVAPLVAAAAIMFAVAPLFLRLTRTPRFPATLIIGPAIGALGGTALLDSGVRSEAMFWLPIVPIATALLLGARAVPVFTAIVMAVIFVVAVRDARSFGFAAIALHAGSVVAAVAFGAVLGRKYEIGRVQAITELTAREARFRALVEAMPDVLLRMDRSGRLVDVHWPRERSAVPRADTPEDLLGRSLDEAFSADIAGRLLDLARLSREDGAVRDDTIVFENLHLQTIVVPLPEGGTLAILRDVSALATAQRERAVSEKRAELLVASVRQRDEFLSVASHELRTPLTAIKLWLERANRLARNGDVPRPVREAQERVTLQVARLETLVDELLDVSRLLEGRLRLRLAPVRLDDVVEEVVERLELDAERRGSEVVVECHAVEGEWDRTRLDQIVTNLVSNALKYGAGRPVEVRVHATEAEAILVVRDHGPGIAPEDHARIFERFERLSTSRAQWGLGLGLWITRRLVLSMGGRIDIESRQGEGSTFTIRLPTRPATTRLAG